MQFYVYIWGFICKSRRMYLKIGCAEKLKSICRGAYANVGIYVELHI